MPLPRPRPWPPDPAGPPAGDAAPGPTTALPGAARSRPVLTVRADLSWLVALVLVAWAVATVIMPAAAPDRPAAVHWAAGLATAVLLLASVALHGLGHGLAARGAGYGVRRLELSLLGGVTRLEPEPATPAAVARIAVAGPLVSVGVAAAAALAHVVLVELDADRVAAVVPAVLALGNLALALLNLLPAPPLDGSHLLWAALCGLGAGPGRAARVTALSGRLIGAALVVVTVIAAVSGALAVALGTGGLALVVRHPVPATAPPPARAVRPRAA